MEFLFLDVVATSSSVNGNIATYGPQLAVDGKIATGNTGFFLSSTEDYPWLQIKLSSPQALTGLVIVNRADRFGGRLKNLEIRAGVVPVPIGFKGLLKFNKKAGHFPGPGKKGKTYNINFAAATSALYVTLQITDKASVLNLNEVTVNAEGKKNQSRIYSPF